MGDAKIVPIFVKKVCSTGILSLGGGLSWSKVRKREKTKTKKTLSLSSFLTGVLSLLDAHRQYAHRRAQFVTRGKPGRVDHQADARGEDASRRGDLLFLLVGSVFRAGHGRGRATAAAGRRAQQQLRC